MENGDSELDIFLKQKGSGDDTGREHMSMEHIVSEMEYGAGSLDHQL
jgi:hypothetical protein